jgi:hypothetical protein
MWWFILLHLFSTLLEWMSIGRRAEREKDLEILLLRRQLAIVERQLPRSPRLSRVEKLTLAVITVKVKTATESTARQLHDLLRLFQPETVLKWIVSWCGERGRLEHTRRSATYE